MENIRRGYHATVDKDRAAATSRRLERLSFLIDSICALFVLLFLYTVIEKLRSPEVFESAMRNSPLLHSHSRMLSWLIPVMEMVLAILLVWPRTRTWGLILSIALLILFTGYITYMIYSAPKLPCACGGVIEKLGWNGHLIFNAAFILLGMLGLMLVHKQKRIIAISRGSRKPV